MNAIEIEDLDWEKMDNLIPAIVQDAETLQVLMLAYMNKKSIEVTLESGQVTFYSRSKQRLWTKGESSGNTLKLVEIIPDCDQDTLLIRVLPSGKCCHLDNTSCFGRESAQGIGYLMALSKVIQQRNSLRPKNSYTTTLFEEGIPRIAQKVGEEGVEVALAGVKGDPNELINELADLMYHILVLIEASNISIDEVIAELKRR